MLFVVSIELKDYSMDSLVLTQEILVVHLKILYSLLLNDTDKVICAIQECAEADMNNCFTITRACSY